MNKETEGILFLAAKSVMNALSDHYFRSKSTLSQEEYWKKHLRLTNVQAVDSYVQGVVGRLLNPGLDTVDTLASRVTKELGL